MRLTIYYKYFLVPLLFFGLISTFQNSFVIDAETCPYDNVGILDPCYELGCNSPDCPGDNDAPSYTYCNKIGDYNPRCVCADPSWFDPPVCDLCTNYDACGGDCGEGYRCVKKAGDSYYTCEVDSTCQGVPECTETGKCGASANSCPQNHVCLLTSGKNKCNLDTTGIWCGGGSGGCNPIGSCADGTHGYEGYYCKVSDVPPYNTFWEPAPCQYGLPGAKWLTKEECEAGCKTGPCCGVIGSTPCTPNKCGVAAFCEADECCVYYEYQQGGGYWACSIEVGDDPGDLPSFDYKGPKITSLGAIINPTAKILYYGGLFIGISFIVLSGYKLMTSQGNPQKTQDAQEQLTAAILGIVFILLSAAILRVIINQIVGGEISI